MTGEETQIETNKKLKKQTELEGVRRGRKRS